jgi:hypothetical protein
LLDLFNFLFYPAIGGVVVHIPGLVFLLLFEPAEQYTPEKFPRSWLAYPSTSAGFGREDIDPVALVKDYPGPLYKRASHQRFEHQRPFTLAERLDLLRWFLGRVNRLLYELTDVANFTQDHDPEAPVDPVFGFEHLLTEDRLLRKTMLAMSLEEALTAKLMAFEIADLYDTLSERLQGRTGKTVFFKRLFHTQDGPALLSPLLGRLPSPFGDYLRDLTAELYAKVEQALLDSVWVRSKVTANREVVVRNEDLTAEAPTPLPQFVAELMRAYRNAHHGYFSTDPGSRNRPSRYLFLVDGNLPAEMSVLPVLWWLAYLADPGMVGWRHLDIGAYD